MVFGFQPASATEGSRSDKPVKARAHPFVAGNSVKGALTMALRDRKYTVREGDTVSTIASSAGVSSAELLAANGLSWKTLIFVGQQLDIPQTTSGSSVPTMSPSLTRHRVVAGETLEIIGRLHGVQPRALMTANGLDRSSRLIVGQRLVVPDAGLMSEIPAESVA
jgi:LysM repeat protein